MKSKHHLWVHVTEDMALEGNSRHYATYCDESLNRDFARIAQCCHRRTFEPRLFAEYSLVCRRSDAAPISAWWWSKKKHLITHVQYTTNTCIPTHVHLTTRARTPAISGHCWRRDRTHYRCRIRFLDVALETLWRQLVLQTQLAQPTNMDGTLHYRGTATLRKPHVRTPCSNFVIEVFFVFETSPMSPFRVVPIATDLRLSTLERQGVLCVGSGQSLQRGIKQLKLSNSQIFLTFLNTPSDKRLVLFRDCSATVPRFVRRELLHQVSTCAKKSTEFTVVCNCTCCVGHQNVCSNAPICVQRVSVTSASDRLRYLHTHHTHQSRKHSTHACT